MQVKPREKMAQRSLYPDHMLGRGADKVLRELPMLGSHLKHQRRRSAVGSQAEQHGINLLGLKRPRKVQLREDPTASVSRSHHVS